MSYGGTSTAKAPSLANVMPGLAEKSGPTGRAMSGKQVVVSVPIGPPLLVDGATYKHTLFVAPVDNCFIVSVWLTGSVKIGQGTNTFALDNYDASANAARNVQSATNIDPDTITAVEGLELTLSATASNLQMDEGDVLNCTLVCGTMSTAGQGYSVTAVINVPDVVI